MSLLRTLAVLVALASGAPALAQEPQQAPNATFEIVATSSSGRPTLMSYLAKKPLPETIDGLLARLNEPGVCGEDAWPVALRDKPCAIIIYYLSDRDETSRTPQLVFRTIQYVTRPDDPAQTAVRIYDIDGRLKSYSGGKLDEPLRPLRVEDSCTREWDTRSGKQIKKCKRVEALYLPIGILGYVENEQHQILTGAAKERFFSVADAAIWGAPDPGARGLR